RRVKQMVKEGRTVFFLESIGVEIETTDLTPAIEAAIVRIVDGQRLQPAPEYRPATRPRRRLLGVALALQAQKADADADEQPAQEPLPGAAERAEREKDESARVRQIAQREMECAGDRLDALERRGLLASEEVVELRQIFDVEGRLRRGEIDEDEAERLRGSFDEVLRKR
ncbi:MAG: hypothetical protein KC616_27075, partial [Myxococcales bacterium]|nr:hypothetical protein [Myxococcales bacterium]